CPSYQFAARPHRKFKSAWPHGAYRYYEHSLVLLRFASGRPSRPGTAGSLNATHQFSRSGADVRSDGFAASRPRIVSGLASPGLLAPDPVSSGFASPDLSPGLSPLVWFGNASMEMFPSTFETPVVRFTMRRSPLITCCACVVTTCPTSVTVLAGMSKTPVSPVAI